MNAPANHDSLFESVAMSPLAMVLSNPRRADNPLELANPAFCGLTGYSESEIIGRNCRFLAGESTDPAATEKIRVAIRSRRPVLVDILNYRSDGSPFRNGVMISPTYGAEGDLAWFLAARSTLARRTARPSPSAARVPRRGSPRFRRASERCWPRWPAACSTNRSPGSSR